MHRSDFPMLDSNLIYFDNGATTLKPKCVIDKMNEYYNEYSANAHRGDYDIAARVDDEYEHSRDIVAKFLNCEREEIVFTSGTTESLNLIALGYFKDILKENDEILITDAEHASNVLPWYNLAKTNNVCVNTIKLDEHLHVTLDNVKASITDNTKVISLAYVTNVIGDIRPLKEIIEYAHSKNILVVIDAAQAVSHIKIDVKDLDCDFLAFSAHKIYGPTGVGVLYGKRILLENVTPIILGGGMNESFDSIEEIYYKELPHRLEAGTPNIVGVIGLGASIEYIDSIGFDDIRKQELLLRDRLLEGLKNIPHIELLNEYTDTPIVTFNVNRIFAQDVAYYLNKYNICVRAGNHCAKILKKTTDVKNTIRVSMAFYNTIEEVDKLIELLSDKDKILSEMI